MRKVKLLILVIMLLLAAAMPAAADTLYSVKTEEDVWNYLKKLSEYNPAQAEKAAKFRQAFEMIEAQKSAAEGAKTTESAGQAQKEQVDVYKGQELVRSVVFQIGLNKYFVNNRLPGYDMDVAPFVQEPEGRTFVPVRYFCRALGVKDESILWDNESQQVSVTDPGFPKVKMTIGSREVYSDGALVPGVDAAPMLVPPGRTMLPARFTAQALGYNVTWDDKLNLVICWKGDPGQAPDISAVRAELSQWEWNETGYRLPKKDGTLIKEVWSNGIYWTKAGLEIDSGRSEMVDLDLLINALDDGGTLEAYDQAEEILASRFGQEFAGEVMAYARQKKSWRDMCRTEKFFTTPTGQKLRVAMGEGTNITVYVGGN
ncbi:MAG: hypothetical protein HPY89_00730 [Pelotomaculum sp.]|nr:hypothetical protein [Pelotomaculum sp.]